MCAEGSFRQDLYFRLNGYALRLPPLCDRGNDIDLLIEHFVEKISDKLGKQIDEISTDAYQTLVHYDWPGNIRGLQTTLSRAVLDARTTLITLACIPVQARYQLSHASSAATLSLPRADGPSTPASHTVSQCDVAELLQSRLAANSQALHAEAIEYGERFVISEVLVQFHGNQSQAATHLGISRGSLRHKIRALGHRSASASVQVASWLPLQILGCQLMSRPSWQVLPQFDHQN